MGKELDLSSGKPLEMLDSTHLTTTDPSVMQALSKQVHVFSRVSPSNKLGIVKNALQSTGRVVAMTGDGINDGARLEGGRHRDCYGAVAEKEPSVAHDVADVVSKKMTYKR